MNVEKSLQISKDWIFKQKEYFASLRRLEVQRDRRVFKFYQKINKRREEKRKEFSNLRSWERKKRVLDFI